MSAAVVLCTYITGHIQADRVLPLKLTDHKIVFTRCVFTRCAVLVGGDETKGTFKFPAELYDSYESAAHFRRIHGNHCITVYFLTGHRSSSSLAKENFHWLQQERVTT